MTDRNHFVQHPGGRYWLQLAALGLLHLPRVFGQIYTFESEPVPEPKSLRTMYAFYVYSHKDAPDKSVGHPFVKFHGLSAHSTSQTKTDADLQDYRGLQLSILTYRDFWKVIDPHRFCSSDSDVAQSKAPSVGEFMVMKPVGADDADVNLYSHTLSFHAEKDVQLPVHSTGVYILTFSNCGDISDAVVSGSIIVKNAYGFLPGNEFHKMPFYGWLSAIYTLMALVWTGLSWRHWRELFHIQYCIAVVILFGLLESCLWLMFFNDWNSSGLRSYFLSASAILSSVVKTIVSYMLILVASLGWGVTRPYLDNRTLQKVQALTIIYIILDFIHDSVLSIRHSHTLSLPFVLLCLLPVALINGVIFYWIFSALSSLIEVLKERRQTDKLLLFERLWWILVVAMVVASGTLFFQISDLSRSISIRWHYQWLLSDGISHLLFLAVLAAMMYLWAPGSNSQRYAYSHKVDCEDRDDDDVKEKRAANVWVEEDGVDDDGEDESFWATTHGTTGAAPVARPTSVAPDSIGVAAEGAP